MAQHRSGSSSSSSHLSTALLSRLLSDLACGKTAAQPGTATQEPLTQRTGRHAVRPGRFNLAGEFFDLDGNALTCIAEVLQPHEALAEVRAGAIVAFEACGCGGSGSCAPDWPGPAARKRMVAAGEPAHVRGPAPTWIGLWSGSGSRVVFLHGEYEWADAL